MTFVINASIVAESLSRLRARKIHPLFAGYLHLQQRAGQLGHLNDLSPDFLAYFKKYFLVRDHPLGSPYIRIFTDKAASSKNLWFNENVAGSYAPSSLRQGQPFRKVVNIDGKVYSLPQDHAQRAHEHLLYSQKIDVRDLAIVMYRDYGFIYQSMTISSIIDTFCYEFGYSLNFGDKTQDNFNMLFDYPDVSISEKDWLEKYES